MPRTTGPSTNPRIISGYAPYADRLRSRSSATTEGRRQLLLEDPHARDVQPEQVTCTHCAKIVRLQKGKSYHLAHWLDHRWRCDRSRVQPPPRAKSLSLIERKIFLEADEDAKVVEPDRVLCGKCNRVVRLRKGRPYGLSCWNQHKSICQIAIHPSISSGSGSTLPVLPYPGGRTHLNYTLQADPLVASIETQRLKCALCLAWIDVELQQEQVWHVWRRHRTVCMAGYFAGNDRVWTRPDFSRTRHGFGSGSGLKSNQVDDSSVDTPNSPTTFSRRTAMRAQSQAYSGKIPPITSGENTPSSFPSLPLSFKTSLSATNSMESTPPSSPLRGASLFPKISAGRSSARDGKREHHRIGFDALKFHLPLHSSDSPTSHQSSRPPPYLEHTPLSLSLPTKYWRFESSQ